MTQSWKDLMTTLDLVPMWIFLAILSLVGGIVAIFILNVAWIESAEIIP